MSQKKEKKVTNDSAKDNNNISENIAILDALEETLGETQRSKTSFGNKKRGGQKKRKNVEREIVEVKRKINKKFKILLADLQANQLNKEIEVDCQIVGEGELQAIPTQITFQCAACGERENWKFNTDLEFISKLDEIQREEYLSILQDQIYTPRGKLFSKMKKTGKNLLSPNCLENNGNDHHLKITINGNTELQVIFVKDLLDADDQIRKAQMGKPLKAYLIGNKTNDSKKVRLQGTLAVDAKDNNIRPIIFQIDPLADELQYFSLTSEDKENFSCFKTLTSEIIEETIAPTVIGRIEAKLAALLTAHSPLEFVYMNKKVLGLLRTLYFGDTSTCKTEITEHFLENIKLGEFAECETSSRTGLIYTIDSDNKIIIWGVLVQNDLGLVAFDGFQQMRGDELSSMREILSKGRVSVKRSVSGEANARTRIIACGNATQPMKHYLYKCKALTPTSIDLENGFKPFYNTPEVRRWHLFIPFEDEDVKDEAFLTNEWGKRQEDKRLGITREKIDYDVLRRHILWVWSRTRDQIMYTEEATEATLEEAVRIQKTFSHSSLPIVHKGFHETIARVSVAFACLYHSTDETQEKVIVKVEHVELAIEFLEDLFSKLELNSFIAAERKGTVIEDEEEREIFELISKSPNRIILETLAIKGTASSRVLAEICEKSKKTIKRRIIELAAEGLIESKRGVGSTLTPKGTQAVKKLKSYGSDWKSNHKQIMDKISELSKSACTLEDLTRELPNVSDLETRLKKLAKEGILLQTLEKDYRVV